MRLTGRGFISADYATAVTGREFRQEESFMQRIVSWFTTNGVE